MSKQYDKLKRTRSKAEKLWALKHVKEYCEVCGGSPVSVHHFYYKGSFPHLRYDEDNGITLCIKCHAKLHFRDPKLVNPFIVEARGQEWFERLQEKSMNPPKYFKTCLSWYQDKLKELQ